MLKITIGILIGFTLALVGVLTGSIKTVKVTQHEISTIENKSDVDIPQPTLKEWDCKLMTTCEGADWIGIDGNGRARPEDHCSYEYGIILAAENPDSIGYGSKCREVAPQR